MNSLKLNFGFRCSVSVP